ncbi:expressed unknown protein [Seminavis robusta]|uniref:Uncharacterized protein n=1 Tax=Seminavis robusta TaxID=568900 RepID=A0A9N8DGW3_9STRA|nr:expressed unknown protein [Seminavis robusta]|eukprot:Sro83_g044540.1 n/a (260) ;mRNA; r:111485-112364
MASKDEIPDVEKGEVEATPAGVNLPEEPPEARILKPIPDSTAMEKLMGLVAAIAVGTSLAAIIIERSFLVILAGILSSFVGPYAYAQQTQLTEIKALKETQMAVQNEVNRLKNENNRLDVNIGQMEQSLERLEDVKTALDTITATQGMTVKEFEQQVAKSRNNLNHMQLNVKNVVINNLMNIMERIDTDGDDTAQAHEVEETLDAIKKLHGVKVNDGNFRKAFSGKTVKSIMNVVSNIKKIGDIPPEDRIFEFPDMVDA